MSTTMSMNSHICIRTSGRLGALATPTVAIKRLPIHQVATHGRAGGQGLVSPSSFLSWGTSSIQRDSSSRRVCRLRLQSNPKSGDARRTHRSPLTERPGPGRSPPAAGSGQWAAGSGQRAAGSGQWAAGSGQRAMGSGQRAAGSQQRAAGSRQQKRKLRASSRRVAGKEG